MTTTDSARKFLESLHRFDLAKLVAACEVELGRETVDNGFFEENADVAVVKAPAPVHEALRCLPQHDRKRVAEAIASVNGSSTSPDDIRVEAIPGKSAQGLTALLAELIVHREMMIDVSTGGKRIQEVNDYYIARQARIQDASAGIVEYKNDFATLWEWYHHWDSHLPQYRDRRAYISDLFKQTISTVSQRSALASSPREETGWERVDRALLKARGQLGTAAAEEDYQAIGLLCREIIISLAQAVYDPGIHESLDGVQPSSTDANRMLEAYVAHVFPGDSYKEVRAHHRASLALALNLQHRRTATKQLAALCLEATASTVAVISIIARPADD